MVNSKNNIFVWCEQWTCHDNTTIFSPFDLYKIDLVHVPTTNLSISIEKQCYLFMNETSLSTLYKQFNTVHFVQVYMVRNSLYMLFFSVVDTSSYCFYFSRVVTLKKQNSPSFYLLLDNFLGKSLLTQVCPLFWKSKESWHSQHITDIGTNVSTAVILIVLLVIVLYIILMAIAFILDTSK